MAKRVQFIRHTTVQADAFLGLDGEITIDTDKKEARVHDGLAKGGFAQARRDLANVLAATASNDGKMTAAQVVDLANVISNLAAEVVRAQGAEATLQTNIDTEAATRSSADATLQSNIDAESSNRSSADTTLQANIDSEATARADADALLTPMTRKIAVSLPLAGGGDLQFDRTLSINAATGTTAGSMSAADKAYIDALTVAAADINRVASSSISTSVLDSLATPADAGMRDATAGLLWASGSYGAISFDTLVDSRNVTVDLVNGKLSATYGGRYMVSAMCTMLVSPGADGFLELWAGNVYDSTFKLRCREYIEPAVTTSTTTRTVTMTLSGLVYIPTYVDYTDTISLYIANNTGYDVTIDTNTGVCAFSIVKVR